MWRHTFTFVPIPALSSVQFSHSVVSDSATPWNTARQASLSITNSRSLPKLMSIESVRPSNHLILCCCLLPSIFPDIRVFSNESSFRIRCQNIGVSASKLVLSMNTQDWFPLGWTGWISLLTLQCGWTIISNNALNNKQFPSCFIMPFWQTVYIKSQIAVGMLEAVYSVCLVNLYSWLEL